MFFDGRQRVERSGKGSCDCQQAQMTASMKAAAFDAIAATLPLVRWASSANQPTTASGWSGLSRMS